jgi:hypothetical protein
MMNSQARTLLGALVLCAISICAFAAQGASATGLTAVECVEVAPNTGKYNNSHCTTPQIQGNFETVVLSAGKHEVEGIATRALGEGKHGPGNTAEPVGVFHSTFGGVEVTVTCGAAIGSGSIENIEEGGEMKIKGTGGSGTATECHASPRTKPTKICTVQGTAPAEPIGAIATNPLTAITGAEHKVTIKPLEGTTFTKFKVNASGGECFTTTAVEVTVTGEAWGRANTETHSHLTLDEASNAGGPLRANGAFASQTETVTGFTKGNKEATVGAETF